MLLRKELVKQMRLLTATMHANGRRQQVLLTLYHSGFGVNT